MTRRKERSVLGVHKRGATRSWEKMVPSLRVAPQLRPAGVARRSFRMTKLYSVRLAWTYLGQQRNDRMNVNRP